MGNAGPWTIKREAERAKKALEKKHGVKAWIRSEKELTISNAGNLIKKKMYRVYWKGW